MNYNEQLRREYISEIGRQKKRSAQSRYRKGLMKRFITSLGFITIWLVFVGYVISQWSDINLRQQIIYLVLALVSFGTYWYVRKGG